MVALAIIVSVFILSITILLAVLIIFDPTSLNHLEKAISLLVLFIVGYTIILVILSVSKSDYCISAGYDAITFDPLGKMYCITKTINKVPLSEVMPR